MKKDCKELAKEQITPAQAQQQSRGKGRIMAVAVDQDDDESRVVRGNLLINNFKVFVLFDSGCTHSFITPKIVKQLDLNLSTLKCPLKITAARGEPKFSTLGVKTLRFEIQGRTYV